MSRYTFEAYKQNTFPETCVGDSDGSVTLVGAGGVPPYQYTVEGISPPWASQYQSIGQFSNLPAGTFIGYVKDNQGTITTTSFTIQNGSTTNFYTLNINQNILTEGGNQNVIFKTGNFNIFANPSLLNNTTVSFKVVANVVESYNTEGDVDFILDFDVKKNGISQNTTQSTTFTNTNSGNYDCGDNYE